MFHNKREKMAPLFNSRLNSKSKLFPIENNKEVRVHKKSRLLDIIRVIIIIVCAMLFVWNSYAIFRDFLNDKTIISTKVIKSPDRTLLFPLILICNESAFKQPIMTTDFAEYGNNTIALNDFLIDIVSLKNAGHAIIQAKPVSIKQSVEEIFTAFHGTCFLVKENIKVIGKIFTNLQTKVKILNAHQLF